MNGKSITEVVLEAARDMKMDKKTLRELEAIALEPLREVQPKELRAFREKENVSQAVMARYLNVTPSTIQKWERGEVKPQRAALRLLHIVLERGLEIVISTDVETSRPQKVLPKPPPKKKGSGGGNRPAV